MRDVERGRLTALIQWFPINRLNRWITLCLLVIMTSVSWTVAASNKTLRQGDRGTEVVQAQEWLITLGYMEGEPTGYFGKMTLKAVQQFQRDHKLRPDGIIGKQTVIEMRNAVHNHLIRSHQVNSGETVDDIAERFEVDPTEIRNYNGLADESSLKPGLVLRIPPSSVTSRGRSAVELVSWDNVNQFIPIGSVFRIIDIETGLSFRAYRKGGHLHADSEPLSREDTAIFSAIYGGRWSWERRAVLVEFRTRRIAASINGMPHGRQAIAGNGFNGHFCVHFQGSRLHKSGRIDQLHQEKILQAAGMLRIRPE